MATRRHRSFRFAPETLERLERHAADTRMTQTALAELLLEPVRLADGRVEVDGEGSVLD